MKFEPPKSPEKMNEKFASAYNSGILENLNLLFEHDAKVSKHDGSIISGYKNYNSEHKNLLKLGGKMTSTNKFCIQFEDIALLKAEWKIETENENGEKIVINGTSSEVVRKQNNGDWLYIIDNPFSS